MQGSQVYSKTRPAVEYQPQSESQHQRIGIYGGTFNPVHNAHLLVADQVGHALCLNKVLLMPDAIPPHVDPKSAISADLRRQMLELAIAGNPLLGIEDLELQRGGVSYTYDTMKTLIDRHPDTDYYFIIGGDMVDYLDKWYRIQDLVKLPRFHFVGVRRPHAQNETKYPVVWVDIPEVDISSSDIRTRIRQGQSVNYLLPRSVAAFIKEHHLYND
ncbi:nicotinate-nucleotide adenylyltransferase [Limosilactobacillus antri]|uniref:Probable nicotinate-nucleotide adenylyltransferase n=1 Tax=Limosilactobacillus antri DSM 16041 TaxID=525309 RepID=C8P9A9_9LACO|nr:nicotinate-nucleotide adenylyltransferase [Limosilactobacillus antri]EEW52926.1 nicotinate-nucleotide adenylyltransferase [Limosilactobacillus antri DSM 16041]KRK59535.1 nicotinate-nucleotide adenylyltransferase [Limosilactobacillus antri DSM 16041]